MDEQFEQYASVESGSVNGGPPRRLVAFIVAAFGVAVMVFIGFRVTDAASGTAAGADSSTDAVTEFMSALSDENVIETFALLPPSEVGHAVELYVPGVELAQQSGELVSDDPLSGIDITIVGEVTRVEELHPEIHRVYLNSDAIVRVVTDPSQMDPAMAVDVEASDETMRAEEFLSEFKDVNDSRAVAEPFVVAVRERGQWFVSPLYTSMEYLREYVDVDVPDFSASRELAGGGADSPEGVIERIVEPIDDLDETDVLDALDEAIASLEDGSEADFMADLDFGAGTSLVAPDEIDVFVDYAPVFASLAEELQMSTDEAFGSGYISAEGEAIEDLIDDNYCTGGHTLNIEGEPCIPASCDVNPNYCDPNYDDSYYDDSYYDDSYYEEPPTLLEILEELRTELNDTDVAGSVDLDVDTLVESMSEDRAKVSVTAAKLHGEVSWQDRGEPRSSVVLDAEIYDGICGRYSLVTTGPEPSSEAAYECAEIPGDRPDGAFIMTREIDGRWYFSPVETIVEYARFAIQVAAAED